MDLPAFTDNNIGDLLDKLDDSGLDNLDIGVVKMDLSGVAVYYNRFESERTGLSPQRVIGREFFVDVAPCAHNYLVAQRLFDADSLDATIDYVFTWKMKRSPVLLRLIKSLGSSYMYMLVQPRLEAP